MSAITVLEPVAPTEHESQLAEKSSRTLSYYVQDAEEQTIRVVPKGGKGEEVVTIPAIAFRLLVNILTQMAQGNAVTLIPVHAELTTQEAADMLNISRPSLIQLLDEGKIEFRRVGTHRRVRFEGLMAYKRRADADRRAALAELVAYDQELGI